MSRKFYLISGADSPDAFMDMTNEGPSVFDTEEDAIEAAKSFSGPVLVVMSVADVRELPVKHKVTRIK